MATGSTVRFLVAIRHLGGETVRIRYLVMVLLVGLLGWSRMGATRAQENDPAGITFAENQDSPVVYLSYNVHLDLLSDGRFRVREVQEIYFKEPFRSAFAEIPLAYSRAISNVVVYDEQQNYHLTPIETDIATTFYTEQGQNETGEDVLFVSWAFEESRPGQIRTFTLEYVVEGGLWVYEEGDRLEWRAVPANRGGVPVYASQVILTFPFPPQPTPIETNAFGPAFNVTNQNSQIIFTATEPLPDGLAFQVLTTFPHGLVTAEVQEWQRQEDSAALRYRLTNISVALLFNDNGSIAVTEQQQVAVDGGALYSGFKSLNLATLEAITDLQIFEGDQAFLLDEGGCDYCFWVVESGRSPNWVTADRASGELKINGERSGRIAIDWYVPALVKGESTTFTLQYEAQGALQVNDNGQLLIWNVVSGYDVAVETAEVIIGFPAGVSLETAHLEGGRLQRRANGQVAIIHEGAIPAGASWQIRVTLPPQATQASKPDWQQAVEQAAAAGQAIQAQNRMAAIRTAQTQLTLATLSGLLLMGGWLAVLLVWYSWGRDRPGQILPDYLSEPPSTLPPGLVAYLLEETPTVKGVLASLLHLATLGLLRVDFSEALGFVKNYDGELGKGQAIQLADGQQTIIPNHLVTLFNGLRAKISGDQLQPTPLYLVDQHLSQLLPQVYLEMGQEAGQFFAESPQKARHRWLSYGQWLIIGGVVVAIGGAFGWLSQLGWVVVGPGLSLGLVGVVMMVVSRWMAQRTPAGVEEAAKWRAFRSYLQNLKQYGDEKSAQQILDRYFGYAVALNVETIVLAQVQELNGVAPVWTRPVVFTRPAPALPDQPQTTFPPLLLGEIVPAREPTQPTSAITDSGRVPLSLENLATSMSRRLETANANLTSLLSQALGNTEPTPFNRLAKGSKGVGNSMVQVVEAILDDSAGYRDQQGSGGSSSGGSSRWRSSRSSGGSGRSRSSGGFSGRNSSGRRSGGGGSRGFRR